MGGGHLASRIFLENVPRPIPLPTINLTAVASLSQKLLLVSGNSLFRTLCLGGQEGFYLRTLRVLDQVEVVL